MGNRLQTQMLVAQIKVALPLGAMKVLKDSESPSKAQDSHSVVRLT